MWILIETYLISWLKLAVKMCMFFSLHLLAESLWSIQDNPSDVSLIFSSLWLIWFYDSRTCCFDTYVLILDSALYYQKYHFFLRRSNISHPAQDNKSTCTTVAFSYSPMCVPDHGAAVVVCHAGISLHCLFWECYWQTVAMAVDLHVPWKHKLNISLKQTSFFRQSISKLVCLQFEFAERNTIDFHCAYPQAHGLLWCPHSQANTAFRHCAWAWAKHLVREGTFSI